MLLDEALVHFQDVEDVDACLRLVEAFPRLLVVRTFSKAYGLSGLRAGYAVSSDASLLAAVAPVLGVNALTQAAVEHALRTGDAEIERRRQAVSRERARLLEALADLPVDVVALTGELRLAGRSRPERRGARPRPAPPGRDSWRRAARWARTITYARRCATRRRPTACCARWRLRRRVSGSSSSS